jgi:transposase
LADVEILARVERRRTWSAAEKAALLAEIDAEGGKVRLVARRHRVAESLLYNWRAARRAAAAMQAPAVPAFIPLGLVDGTRTTTRAPEVRPAAGGIEIALANGARIRVDAGVDEAALTRVLRAVKTAA